MAVKKTRVAIIGAGITGLSLAYFLSKRKDVEIFLLEKNERPGNWLQTDQSSGFLFERGPRTFRSASIDLLHLIQELQLENELIFSAKDAKRRYLYVNAGLQEVPMSPLSLIFSPLTSGTLLSLITEWRVGVNHHDESIFDFASRRFNQKIAETFFDPLTLGIYGQDCRTLSVRSCFPELKKAEETYGSLTKAILSKVFQKKEQRRGLFSFKNGVETLVNALSKNIRATLMLNEEVKGLQFGDEIKIQTTNGHFFAEHLFCTQPAGQMSQLIEPHDQGIATLLKSIRSKSLTVVNLGYRKSLLHLNGFGYLVPSTEGEDVLGCVFDSKVFPTQNRSEHETRLSVMIRDFSDEKCALNAVKRHLGIEAAPDAVIVTKAKDAIPHYEVGHQLKIEQIKDKMKEKFPNITLLGNYIPGLSVNDCIAKAKAAEEQCLEVF